MSFDSRRDSRRVVVTGIGLVSPSGLGTEETWQSILAGRSGIAPITLFDASRYSTRFAGEVKGFDPLVWLDKKDLKKCGRFIQFALAGAVSTREYQSDSSSLSLGRPDDWINQLLPPVSRARMAL